MSSRIQIERQTGLKFAGTSRMCGMDIDIFTNSGKLPYWSGAPDPGSSAVTGTKAASKISDGHSSRSVPHYLITDKGKEAMRSYDATVREEMYVNIMRVMSVIADGATRQVDISRSLELDQRKVWYIVNKISRMGLICIIEGESA